MRNLLTGLIPRASGLAVLAAAVALTLLGYEPNKLEPHPVLLRGLLEGSHTGYISPGSEIKSFRSVLPPRGTLTFLMDRPYKAEVADTEFYHRIQNYLCPLVLNPRPEENAGILFCSSDAMAQQRLQETGYRMIMRLDEGKGIIVKNS